MKILLTNDDSHDSPLFHMAIDALTQWAELTIVVPADEQSWKGKSMTRFGRVQVEEASVFDHDAYFVGGTPADCVNIGIYNLMSSPPDMVVSGINMGINTGAGFLLASGTVGAAIEGNVAGLPAIALSQHLDFEHFKYWHDHRDFSDEMLTYYGELVDQAFSHTWQHYSGETRPVTWSVNFPMQFAGGEPKLVEARLGQTFYKGCFAEKAPGEYSHELRELTIDPDDETDEKVVRSGRISATLIDVTELGQGH